MAEGQPDDDLSGEPEQIKAFRDTWELGIHSYLSYLRDRLLIAKELLTESGSCFMQISDENVHLVRSVMDEVFGSENFCSQIIYKKTSGSSSNLLGVISDFILWYAKDKTKVKFRQLYIPKTLGGEGTLEYNNVELSDGSIRKASDDELNDPSILPNGSKIFVADPIVSDGAGKKEEQVQSFFEDGKKFTIDCGPKRHWKTTPNGLSRLWDIKRLLRKEGLRIYKRYFNDFPFMPYSSMWTDTRGETKMDYVVQTSVKVLERCILMTSDPGDLVIDPTCGSATTAYVAEQWGRRWITIDTSRIALNIAKQRLMTGVCPYYHLYSDVEVQKLEKDGKIKKSVTEKPENQKTGDIRQGFVYEEVPHITLKSLANDEPPETETLYDKPQTDKNRLRVSGPFTVETLQNFEPVSPEELDVEVRVNEEEGAFEEVIKEHLLSTGIKNGRKEEMVLFRSVELLAGEYLHAEGFYQTEKGESKAYFHIGPKFGTVSKNLVNDAIKECRKKGDSDWLVILGFSFESDIEGSTQTTSMGNFEVTKCRIHDDLLQDGLKKKPAKSAASFVTIGEPDIGFLSQKELDFKMESAKRGIIIEDDLTYRNDKIPVGEKGYVKILGLDIYDPIKDVVNARNVHDIAYWMVDDDYDGSNFVVKQVFFCGGDRDEFAKWRKGLDTLAKDNTKKKVEKLFKIEIDDEAFDRLYGHISHPIEVKKKGQKIAVRIVSQFGEESTKVLSI